MHIPANDEIEIALLEPIDQLRPPGPFDTALSQQHLLHRLMTHPLLRVWEIDVRFMRRGALVVMRQGQVVIGYLVQRRYPHREARHGQQLFDGRYEIHTVAENGIRASRA